MPPPKPQKSAPDRPSSLTWAMWQPTWDDVGLTWSQIVPSGRDLGSLQTPKTLFFLWKTMFFEHRVFRTRRPLRAHLVPTWAHFGTFGCPNLDPIGTKWTNLGPTWATLGPTWAPLGPNLGQLGPTWANLDHLGVALGHNGLKIGPT